MSAKCHKLIAVLKAYFLFLINGLESNLKQTNLPCVLHLLN
ncbi:hypothetical protein N646_4572 [Vibrio alginolyticus NBRC 15630 = ATCC 17749]|uniref:Uncharacterized protein n=1 Tax=Vibrio alginolyticus (strain ATCC 17749 / DSM 2171 / NBRC 15630 / NCIMB 1903 / NCTC 12160 / XII-53) TaxID=1219076 RepID=A0A2I3CSD2_VIBAX|nr:hypothetical protein N646_4572 [Vibrio alginolyticus NBRC 15630 = ATCC 17749]